MGRWGGLQPAFSMPEYTRRLPHFHPDDACLFLTWRLWGSLPAKAEARPRPTPGHAFVAADRELDRLDSGPLWLKDIRIAELVSRAILAGECDRPYHDLCAWVVMPNHVHLLILPRVPVSSLMKWLKGSSARGEDRILGRRGNPFWQGRVLRSLPARFQATEPDCGLHRGKPGLGRIGLGRRVLALVQRRMAD